VRATKRSEADRIDCPLDALAAGQLDEAVLHAPPDREALLAQVRVERDVGRRHLETVTELFYDRDWQRSHRGDGVYPQDHLCWAAAGFVDLDNALHRLAQP
jgi:hypothetical protein